MLTHPNSFKTSVNNFQTLAEWLEYCEKLHAKPIDMGLAGAGGGAADVDSL